MSKQERSHRQRVKRDSSAERARSLSPFPASSSENDIWTSLDVTETIIRESRDRLAHNDTLDRRNIYNGTSTKLEKLVERVVASGGGVGGLSNSGTMKSPGSSLLQEEEINLIAILAGACEDHGLLILEPYEMKLLPTKASLRGLVQLVCTPPCVAPLSSPISVWLPRLVLLYHPCLLASSALLRGLFEYFDFGNFMTKCHVLDVLHLWILLFYEDLQEEKELLQEFLCAPPTNPSEITHLGVRQSTIRLALAQRSGLTRSIMMNQEFKGSSIEHEWLPSAAVMSRAFFWRDANNFLKIQPRELIDKRWTRKDKEKRAPHVLAMAEEFNKRTFWVGSQILGSSDTTTRVETLKFFINLARKSYRMRNFYCAYALIVGMSLGPLLRVKEMWKDLPRKHKKFMKKAKMLRADMSKNFMLYRAEYASKDCAQVPHLQVLMRDLFLIEEIGGDLASGPYAVDDPIQIPFHKYAKHWREVCDAFRCMNHLQNKLREKALIATEDMELEEKKCEQFYCVGLEKALDEDQLWERSYECEARVQRSDAISPTTLTSIDAAIVSTTAFSSSTLPVSASSPAILDISKEEEEEGSPLLPVSPSHIRMRSAPVVATELRALSSTAPSSTSSSTHKRTKSSSSIPSPSSLKHVDGCNSFASSSSSPPHHSLSNPPLLPPDISVASTTSSCSASLASSSSYFFPCSSSSSSSIDFLDHKHDNDTKGDEDTSLPDSMNALEYHFAQLKHARQTRKATLKPAQATSDRVAASLQRIRALAENSDTFAADNWGMQQQRRVHASLLRAHSNQHTSTLHKVVAR